MIFFVLNPRQAVLDAAESVGASMTAVADARSLSSLTTEREAVEVADPLDALEVTRALEPIVGRSGHPPEEVLCVGLGDDSSQVAALVNSALGLAGGKFPTVRSLEVMRDKHRLRASLPTDSPLNGLHWSANISEESDGGLRRFFARAPHGIVVKPNSGSGSRGVHSITSERQLHAVQLEPGTYLVEQRFVGPEFSVESISWNGVHRPLVVTEKETGGTSGLVETGHHQPARIPDEHRDRLFDAARVVLDAADYRFGLSHSEFILEDGQPRLIEAHGRVGGDHIADLMKWSVGRSAFEALFTAYQHQQLPDAEPTGNQASVLFPDLRTWPSTDQHWLDTVRRTESVQEADVLKAAGHRGDMVCSADRHAYVILAGSTITEAKLSLQRQKALP